MLDFVEVKNFGLNFITLGFLGTLFFTSLSTWAQTRQYQELASRSKQKGKSLSPSWFVYGALINLATFQYGLATHRLALMYTIVLGVAYGRVAYKLLCYRAFTKGAWSTVMVCVLGNGAMVIWPSPSSTQRILFVFLVGMLGWLLLQPLRLYNEKSAGVFRPEQCLVSILNAGFWSLYALLTDEKIFLIIMPIMILIQLVSLGLWVRYGGDIRSVYRRKLRRC